jgi:hypothetical protein
VTNGTNVLALKGQNSNSPGQRPGIIMVKNIQASPAPLPSKSMGVGWVRGDGVNGVISPGALPQAIPIKPFQGKMQNINHPYQLNVQHY